MLLYLISHYALVGAMYISSYLPILNLWVPVGVLDAFKYFFKFLYSIDFILPVDVLLQVLEFNLAVFIFVVLLRVVKLGFAFVRGVNTNTSWYR